MSAPPDAWSREGQYAWRRGPWRIGCSRVDGDPRYCLSRDDDTRRWCGVTLYNARIFDSPAAAREAADRDDKRTIEHQGVSHEHD